MKKILTLFLATMTLFSCKKDDAKQGCNCGLIVSDNSSDYSVVIRNKCSNNERRFTLTPGDWMNAFVGSEYCITNVSSW
jgi:hypothetical protein